MRHLGFGRRPPRVGEVSGSAVNVCYCFGRVPTDRQARDWSVPGWGACALGVPLLGLLIAAAYVLVWCRWIPIAMDPEFSGWVAPLSQRLSEVRLYTDGAHSPLPPLAFVLLYWVGGGHATWITESTLNFALLSTTVLVTYAALVRATSAGVAFIASLAALPLYLASPKSLAYDAVVQVLVAVAALLVVSETRIRWLAIVGGLALLSKQNTAAGMLAGACLVLLLSRGFGAAMALGTGSVVAGGVGLLVLSPYASPSGFVADVIVHGSEPKGGAGFLVANLAAYAVQLLRFDGVAIPTVTASIALQGGFGVALAGCLTTFRQHRHLGALTIVTGLAALTHSLSVPAFRWWYDTNPLIPVVLAWPLVLLGRAHFVAGLALVLVTWTSYGPTLVRRAESCTVPWPEVSSFRGARMTPEADGLRALVTRVREVTPPRIASCSFRMTRTSRRRSTVPCHNSRA